MREGWPQPGPGARAHGRRPQSLDRDDGHDDVHHGFDELHTQQALAIGTFIVIVNALLTLIYFGVSRRYAVEDV